MSGFFNLFSFWEQKPKAQLERSVDYFLEVLQRHKDLWGMTQSENYCICCPITASLSEVIYRSDLEMHVLIPLGSPGEFVSLRGDKITFSG
jgi:hypothetical protein